MRPDARPLAILARLYEEGRLAPVVDKVLPLAEAQQALDSRSPAAPKARSF